VALQSAAQLRVGHLDRIVVVYADEPRAKGLQIEAAADSATVDEMALEEIFRGDDLVAKGVSDARAIAVDEYKSAAGIGHGLRVRHAGRSLTCRLTLVAGNPALRCRCSCSVWERWRRHPIGVGEGGQIARCVPGGRLSRRHRTLLGLQSRLEFLAQNSC
jgi:hypothetical protein